MNAILLASTGRRRAFEVVTPSRSYSVEYKGSATGIESISVNGVVVAKQQRPLGFVLRFRFLLGTHPAVLEVRAWPWLCLRAVHLWVDNEELYAEGKGLLQSPAGLEEEDLLQRGRIIATTMFAGGIVLVGVNLALLLAFRSFFPKALVLAPMCLLLGIGGMFDPRLCLLGNHAQGRTFPRWTRVVGSSLVVVGLAVGGYVAFLYF